jgi:hypothetical protein
VRLLQLGLALVVARRQAASRGPLLRALAERTPSLKRGTALGGAWHRLVYTDPPAPDDAFELELRRRFRPEVVALSDHLGRDLVTPWGYGRIA